jgi:hypothetical protein
MPFLLLGSSKIVIFHKNQQVAERPIKNPTPGKIKEFIVASVPTKNSRNIITLNM